MNERHDSKVRGRKHEEKIPSKIIEITSDSLKPPLWFTPGELRSILKAEQMLVHTLLRLISEVFVVTPAVQPVGHRLCVNLHKLLL